MNLRPALENLEPVRKKVAKSKIYGFSFLGLGVLLFLLLFFALQLDPLIAIGLAAAPVVTGFIILSIASNAAATYRNTFKREVIATALRTIDPTLQIQPAYGIEEQEFIDAQLFNKIPDRYHTEDLVTGKSDKTPFYFAEVHAEYKTETQTKNGRREHWHTILKGIVFVADFNKHFDGLTLIQPRSLAGSFGAWFSKNIYSFGEQQVVELESPDFSREFIVYSTDQVEARYLLTPAMMARICVLNNRCKETISLSFFNSKMYIAFPLANNCFEAPVFRSLLANDVLRRDLELIGFMFGIITELDLNTRIWTKQ
ncbi:galanin [Pedobacter yulinensis]|uniref:Galanin n=1 Tax=Pedobacter yulinensis TaxID=2126353 RepID=A0A2T3HR78_9SPHI|nr:DUF3137 domain-containing protein [Pedobacter yulinensis]PST84901.1 galanin [Pedobacter yulinensis]